MQTKFTRRSFLTRTAAGASIGLVGPSLFNLSTAEAAQTFVRRNIGGMTAYDPIIVSYRKAIKAMQALPDTNPLSWAYQGAIHWTTLPGPPKTAWDTCEHGSYWFWPWHRMYLYWFERIIRKMSGDACWALPYWDWTSPLERQLPPMFRDTTSELYTVNRSPAMNGGGSLPASSVNYSGAFSFVDFTSASGSLEGTPHGAVHVNVGGWMGSVPTAAQDPIFYLHHCNIDRLWDLWLAQGGGRVDPLGDATWKSRKFTFFNESGATVQMTSCDVLRAALQLQYVYEGEPPQVNETCLKIILPPFVWQKVVLLQLPGPPVTLGSERASFKLDIKTVRERMPALAESKTETLTLELDDVEAERQPGVVWEVYVGLPPNTPPDPEGPYYVGNVALFGTGIRSETSHHYKPAHFAFPVSRALSAAMRSNADAETVEVIFVPQGVLVEGKPTQPKAEATVKVGRATLSIQTQKPR